MVGKQLQHVIKKANAGGNFVLPASVNIEPNFDVGLFRLAMNLGFPHFATFSCKPICSKTVGNVAINRALCSAAPTVMRTQSLQPGSFERSRTKMPRSRMALTNGLFTAPKYISTKFARLGQYLIPRLNNSFSSAIRPATAC